MSWRTIVEPSQGDQDWIQVRECFVRAFHYYPLYKYMVPDEKKRPEFLKQYLEAIYEVTVRNGKSVLLSIKLQNVHTHEKKIIGGVLIVPPSQSSGGWQCERDEDFWDAYQKYNLQSIDDEAFKRLQRYEEWEYERISKHVCSSDVPMWNGIFCAIDPQHAGKGCGSISYSECIRLIAGRDTVKKTTKKSRSNLKTTFQNALRQLDRLIAGNLKKTVTKPLQKPPTVFVLTHSWSAVRFHQKNGLQLVSSLPYEHESSKPEFDVSVLLLSSLDFSQKQTRDNSFCKNILHSDSSINVLA